MALILDGSSLSLEKVVQVARGGEEVRLHPDAKDRINRCWALLEDKIKKKEIMYGVNTGIGELAEVVLTQDQVKDYQKYLIYSHAGSMSRGDKRRLELAMGLIQHPRLLLLDEPTAGMARHDTNRTVELLKKIKERGMTKIIIEHDMHVVFSLADKISVLAQGRIIASGTPDEIRGNPKVQEAYLGGA